MTDPMLALTELQKALNARLVLMQPCRLHPELQVLVDRPNGRIRVTYALIKGQKVKAIALIVDADFEEGVAFFQLGYAVDPAFRGKGLGTEILQKSIEEFKHGMAGVGKKKYILEAIVSVDNAPSNKIATKLLSSSPSTITDDFSQENAFQYLLKIEY